ncbi:MAG: rhomboid family intramembrane serine protease [Planctomycetota bacterium]|nr:rhomboid family intramembrane serine protease [Planctomycetota bacterium]MDA1105780.1 rhomboid family intramembrane serine protease [Planctomycetota bacterium]
MIPLGTDRDPNRPTPATFSIAALCVAVAVTAAFQLGRGDTTLVGSNPMPRIIGALAVLPGHGWEVWRWVTYALTHDWLSIWHLIGNMIFLLAFGRAVERRLGSWGFIGLFVAASILSGLTQEWLEPRGILVGASGAICGVTGAFLALFPRARVRFLNLFILLGVFSLPAPIAVGIQVFFDLYGLMGANAGVAYGAHLAGYVAGFGAMVVLLKVGWLSRTEWDVVYAWKQRSRRKAMRDAVDASQRGGLWQAPARDSTPSPAEPTPPPVAPPDATARRALALQDDNTAAAEWAHLPPELQSKFTSAELLRMGNMLASHQLWKEAVRAWTVAIPKLDGGAQADDVRLLAAVVSWKRIGDGAGALAFLDGLCERASQQAKQAAATLRAEVASA